MLVGLIFFSFMVGVLDVEQIAFYLLRGRVTTKGSVNSLKPTFSRRARIYRLLKRLTDLAHGINPTVIVSSEFP